MKLQWLGHSCFLLTSPKGVRVLMDPFSSSIGLDMPAVEADIVTTSHTHSDHNNKDAARGTYKHLDKPGVFRKGDVEVTGIEAAHDEQGGAQRGKDIIFKVTMDGVSVCHCGDLGHLLTAEQLQAIGHVDVLLIPVGGFFTIDAKRAAEVVRQIGPKVTIPMHYKVKGLGYPIQGVEPFEKAMGGNIHHVDGREIEPGDLAKYAGVVVFSHEKAA